MKKSSVRFREHVMSCREKVNDSVDYKKSPTKLDVKDNFNRIALKIQVHYPFLSPKKILSSNEIFLDEYNSAKCWWQKEVLQSEKRFLTWIFFHLVTVND